AEPYMPVLEALGRLVQQDRRLIELLRQVAPTWLAQLPWLLDTDEASSLHRSTLDTVPERMLREFATFLEVFTSDRTFVLMLEDVHWSDHATMDLLATLAHRVEPCQLLLIATYRPSDAAVQAHPVARLKRQLVARGLCDELALEYLVETEIAEYLRA